MSLSCAIALIAPTAACAQQYANNSPGGYASTYGGFGGRMGPSFGGGFSSISQPVQGAPYNAGRQSAPAGTMQKLEQQLDAVDTPQRWQPTTAVGMPMPMQQMRQPMPVDRRQMMRMLFERASGSTTPITPATPINRGSSGSQAYSYYQTAMNQSTKAHNYGQQARYNQDSWSRKNAASSAEYAATAAESAATSAYQASLSGDSNARGYASQARAAANRARADANRARYNANTIR